MITHLKGNDRIDHWRVQLRYMTLLHRPKMTQENNPIGLEPVCRGLWAICRATDNPLDKNLDLIDRLEEALQEKLPAIYTEINQFLADRQIESAPVQLIQRPSRQSVTEGGPGISPGVLAGIASAGTQALASLQQALLQQSAPGIPAAPFAAGGIPDASPTAMLNQMMERLRVLELQQACGLSALSGDLATAPQTGGLRAFRARDLDLPSNQPVSVAIDTLSHIFEAIFSTPNLPDSVKTIIGRLQIPLLKRSMLDASFYADATHPAKQLINLLAQAAIGLPADTPREHPICVRLETLADSSRPLLESAAGDLSATLETLAALIAERNENLQTAARPYLEIVQQHETQAAAQMNAKEWLGRVLEKTTHPEIVQFLFAHWRRLMEAACLEGGTEGTRWIEYDRTIEDLLWTFQPRSNPEERSRLLALIPTLIRRLNAILEPSDIPAAARAAFLDSCFNLQTAALRARAKPPAPLQPSPAQQAQEPLIAPMEFSERRPATPPAHPPVATRLEQNGLQIEYFGIPQSVRTPRPNFATTFHEGDWISFQLPDDAPPRCGRHCGASTPAGTVLLFNPAWPHAVALAPALLEAQLRDGHARIASLLSLFDDATERALNQISLAV